VRVEVDERTESVGRKIRDAELRKVPYMLVIGDREAEDGTVAVREHRPAMIHRALFGSFERFIGILLEHTAGELPLWLVPVQAIALPIADRHNEAAADAARRLRERGLRVDVDDRTESVGRKIRDAELLKIPYMLVVGDREAQEGTVAVRRHGQGDEGSVAIDEFAARLGAEAATRA